MRKLLPIVVALLILVPPLFAMLRPRACPCYHKYEIPCTCRSGECCCGVWCYCANPPPFCNATECCEE